MGFFELVGELAKLPFRAAGKTIVSALNLIPLPVYELFGHWGTGVNNKPDVRENHLVTKGSNRVHFGSFWIAWTRGVVIRRELGNGKFVVGVWSEEYQDIKQKWTW